MSADLAFLRLQQLISPTLPIGAFTYSQGMEWAVQCGWISNAETAGEWIESLLLDVLPWFELPLLRRLYVACSEDDEKAFMVFSALAIAGRDTAELRQEELQRARALCMVLRKLPGIADCPHFLNWQPALLQTPIAGFALSCHYWGVSLDMALRGFVWAWLESMVSVSVKLVPLGQSDGQKMLHHLSECVSSVCEESMQVSEEDIGASSPVMAIASSLHETQYSRLFRS